MGIKIVENTIHLYTKNTSYIMSIEKNRYLVNRYYGKRIELAREHEWDLFNQNDFKHYVTEEDPSFCFEVEGLECPIYGKTDFRHPALHIELENGTTIINPLLDEYRVLEGKYGLKGLPATYAEQGDHVKTLEIVLEDTISEIQVTLLYGIYEDLDIMTRAMRITNNSAKDIKVLSAQSTAVHLPDFEYDMVQLQGGWGSERSIRKSPLHYGMQQIESTRGASSHQSNPFMALSSKDATEQLGEVYGFNLVYSGNFVGSVEVGHHGNSRIMMGINPFEFAWVLEEGETFTTPECVMTYSDKGFNGMSQNLHALYRTRLCRGRYRDQARPVLINNWEATYMDFDDEKIINLAKEASALGIELFVLDDGWFGERNDDTSSLGDWFVNTEKLKDGMKHLADKIHDLGMAFGLWFEPEMISPKSKLFEKHPDWCIRVPNYEMSFNRHQYVLDMGREDVRTYIIERLTDILESSQINYVKWDMNRHLTEVGSSILTAKCQKETFHRHILGVYDVMETITTRFPEVLFESCSGGGGRFDPGMLYYMPQTWTSDNTDAVERLKIQYGTSMAYPTSCMGAHVSAIPNHQMHRVTSLKMRGDVAMAGNFGYELDLTKLSDAEKDEIWEQIIQYKQHRNFLQQGNFYRLLSPFEGNITSWMVVDEGQEQAMLFIYQVLATVRYLPKRIKLIGLRETGIYQCDGKHYTGSELMNYGIALPEGKGDFNSHVMHFELTK